MFSSVYFRVTYTSKQKGRNLLNDNIYGLLSDNKLGYNNNFKKCIHLAQVHFYYTQLRYHRLRIKVFATIYSYIISLHNE